jgi:hypothetical protein
VIFFEENLGVFQDESGERGDANASQNRIRGCVEALEPSHDCHGHVGKGFANQSDQPMNRGLYS